MKTVSIGVPEALIPKIKTAIELERDRAAEALETPKFRTPGDFVTMAAVYWLSMTGQIPAVAAVGFEAVPEAVAPRGEEDGQ